MKKLIVILVSILFTFQESLPQANFISTSSNRPSYWNIAYTGGVLFNINDKIEKDRKYYPGYNAGLEIYYNMEDRKSAILFRINYGRMKNQTLEKEYYREERYAEFIELTFGPRFYIAKKYFIEGVMGNYITGYNGRRIYMVDPEFNISNLQRDVYMGFGAAIGAGSVLKLSENFDIIIKCKLNALFPILKTILYTEINTGIVFHNKKIDRDVEKKFMKENDWSVTASGGLTNPEFFHNERFEMTASAGFEAACRTDPGFEVYGGLNYNGIRRKGDYENEKVIIDITFGPRFLIGNGTNLGFVEMGTGFYVFSPVSNSYRVTDDLYVGLNIGTGILATMLKDLGFLVKSKMHFIFNERGEPGGYLTVAGGVRYEL